MTMDWTREQTVRLIRSLKSKEILWNSRSKSYRDRRKKALSWNMVESEVGVPVDICKRRVESLLASCRREKNKIIKSKSTDEPEFVYEPKWVFWKEFKFLRGIPDDDEDPLDTGMAVPQLQWSPSARRPPRKRKKANEHVTKVEDQWHYKPQQGDEHDAFGVTIAAKLRKMEENQRLFAENIINQTIYKGLLFQLTPQTEADLFHHRMPQQEEPQQQEPQAPQQWQQHTFGAPAAAYSKPHAVTLQTRQEAAEDFKQINML